MLRIRPLCREAIPGTLRRAISVSLFGVSLALSAASATEGTRTVTADRTGIVTEGDEENNARTITVTVKGNKLGP